MASGLLLAPLLGALFTPAQCEQF
eukprot:COSAG04_NODE_14738_length_557_cov_0.524017_2_plen_23_part_01